MSMNWISKIQEKHDPLYLNCVKKKYHIPVLKGLQIPYTQNPWQDLKVDYGMENSDKLK